MIDGACHCGALRWRTPAPPAWLTACTCSYCRKAGALWGEADPSETRLEWDAEPHRYVHGDRTLEFVSCPRCAMLGWWRSLPGGPDRMKLNYRLADPALVATLRVRTFDGADSWDFLD